MSEIHRKNTTQRLRDKAISGNVTEQDLHDALKVIDAQNELLLRMSNNLRNARKGNKDYQKAIQRNIHDKTYWINKSQIAERRYELVRKQLWDVEDFLRNISHKLGALPLSEIARKHKEEEKRRRLFESELDKAIIKDLERSKNESSNQ